MTTPGLGVESGPCRPHTQSWGWDPREPGAVASRRSPLPQLLSRVPGSCHPGFYQFLLQKPWLLPPGPKIPFELSLLKSLRLQRKMMPDTGRMDALQMPPWGGELSSPPLHVQVAAPHVLGLGPVCLRSPGCSSSSQGARRRGSAQDAC